VLLLSYRRDPEFTTHVSDPLVLEASRELIKKVSMAPVDYSGTKIVPEGRLFALTGYMSFDAL
jgi:hypothetical protein